MGYLDTLVGVLCRPILGRVCRTADRKRHLRDTQTAGARSASKNAAFVLPREALTAKQETCCLLQSLSHKSSIVPCGQEYEIYVPQLWKSQITRRNRI